MDDITHIKFLRGTDGDHHVFGVRRARESNCRAISRRQIDVSAVRQCKAHRSYSFEEKKTGAGPVWFEIVRSRLSDDICPVVPADRDRVRDVRRNSSEDTRRAADRSDEAVTFNFLPFREKLSHSTRQRHSN